jgi:hypothetical protein
MDYVLIKFEKDYADEFDVHGIMVLPLEEWEKDLELYRKATYPFTKGFGTNEELEFNSFKDVERAFKVQPVNEQEYEVFKKFFGKTYTDSIDFGFIPDPPFEE